MGMGMKCMQMEINIKDNLLMDYLKDMESTIGRMEIIIKVILNKVHAMGMESGRAN